MLSVEHWRSVVCAGLACASASLYEHPGRADELDPTRVHAIALAPAQGNRASSDSALPLAPRVRWRVRVGGSVLHAPVVAPGGAILLTLGSQTLAQYDALGRLSWVARLGNSSAAASPLIAADGARLVLTENDELFAFSASGRPLSRSVLPLGAGDGMRQLVALPSGGMMVGSGRRLVEVDAALRVRWSVRAPAELNSVLVDGPRPLAVLQNGSVFELERDGSLEERGGFSGRVDAVVQRSPSRLLALIEGRRLSELDLASGVLTTRFAETDVELLRPLSQNARGDLRVLTGGDLFLGFDANLNERFRSPLPAAAAALRTSTAAILLDDRGTSLVARSGQDVLAVHGDGQVSRSEATACTDPLRPAPLGAGSVVFACRSGVVIRLDDGEALPRALPLR